MAELDDDLKKVLNEVGEELIIALSAVCSRLNKKASGKLLNSFDYKVKTLVQFYNYKIEVEGVKYFDFVDQGRKPGKQPPLNKIQQWVKLKGLPPKSAFPIARKIGRFGIAPTNILNQALKEANLQQFENKIDQAIYKIINEKIKEQLNSK